MPCLELEILPLDMEATPISKCLSNFPDMTKKRNKWVRSNHFKLVSIRLWLVPMLTLESFPWKNYTSCSLSMTWNIWISFSVGKKSLYWKTCRTIKKMTKKTWTNISVNCGWQPRCKKTTIKRMSISSFREWSNFCEIRISNPLPRL